MNRVQNHPERYRDDIQGIRAIGALMIIVYHIWVNKVSGGVDVFFVISGYLMGGKILRQHAKTGTVEFRKFWGALAIRISPSAYFVLFSTFCLAIFFVPATLWASVISEVLHSAVHAENIKLQRLLVDYLARDNPPSPVQQFWALSVQVQFYLLIPFVALVGLRSGLGKTKSRSFGIVLVVLILVSLSYSVIYSSIAPIPTYFSTLARFWEFLVGVLLALATPRILAWGGGKIHGYVAGVSLLVLLFVGIVIPKTTPFPGWVALIPVTASALLIASGIAQTTAWHRVLGSKPLVFLGGFSFTIYLWHWPILVFYRYSIPGKLGIIDGVVIITLSVLLAYLTKVLVEEPIRSMKLERWWKPFATSGLLALPIIAIALGARFMIGMTTTPSRVDEFQHYVEINKLVHGVAQQREAIDISWQRILTSQNNKTEVLSNGCEIKESADGLRVCEYGDTSSSRRIVLVGGSHASQWQPALDIIGKKKGINVTTITKTSCPLGYMDWLKNSTCEEWNRQVIEKILDIRPDAVITNSTRSQRILESNGVEYVPSEYVQQWQKLQSHGIPVVGIRDNPWFEGDPNVCLSLNLKRPEICYRQRQEVLLDNNPANHYAEEIPGFSSIDMSEFFCDSTHCVPHFDGNLLFWDRHHISRSYARQLADHLQVKLENELPDVFR